VEREEIGRRIKLARTDRGLTQGDIAQSIGVAVSTVQRYETGSIEKIKMPVIEAIARALKVNPAWLLGKTESPDPGYPAYKKEENMPDIYLRLAQGAKQMDLSERDINTLLDIARTLKERDKLHDE